LGDNTKRKVNHGGVDLEKTTAARTLDVLMEEEYPPLPFEAVYSLALHTPHIILYSFKFVYFMRGTAHHASMLPLIVEKALDAIMYVLRRDWRRDSDSARIILALLEDPVLPVIIPSLSHSERLVPLIFRLLHKLPLPVLKYHSSQSVKHDVHNNQFVNCIRHALPACSEAWRVRALVCQVLVGIASSNIMTSFFIIVSLLERIQNRVADASKRGVTPNAGLEETGSAVGFANSNVIPFLDSSISYFRTFDIEDNEFVILRIIMALSDLVPHICLPQAYTVLSTINHFSFHTFNGLVSFIVQVVSKFLVCSNAFIRNGMPILFLLLETYIYFPYLFLLYALVCSYVF
jgi:hypothetical protein